LVELAELLLEIRRAGKLRLLRHVRVVLLWRHLIERGGL